MEPEQVDILAKRCAEEIMESEVMAVHQGDVMQHMWDLCPEVYVMIKDDQDARDAVWDATLSELEGVTITYRFKGETVHDRQRRAAMRDKIRTKQELDRAQFAHTQATEAYDRLVRPDHGH